MTFSVAGRCSRTGQLGAATATSDIAVGSRVPHARANVGAVLTQHRTDPLLGPQLAAVDSRGRTAAFSGSRVQPHSAEEFGDGCVALGNMLANDHVGPAMRKAFEGSEDEPLAERLVRAMEAGEAAGGERLPVRSAALLVAGDRLFPLVDLRVDLSDQALSDLRRTWDAYRPLVGEFLIRALDPDHAGTGS